MPQLLLGGFLVVHGLVTTMIGFVAVTNPSAQPLTLPSFFSWWPGPFGRSWLFEAMNLGSLFQMLGGLLWLAAGLALVGGAIGWLGVAPLEAIRYPLLVGGAALGLVAVALYFHPLYLAAVLINVALVALLWGRLTTAAS